MMIPGVSEPICFREDRIHTLLIENQQYLYDTLQDIYLQINRYDGKSVLSINETPVDVSKHVELLTDFINFDINKKTLISNVLSKLDNEALDPTHYLQTQQLLSYIEKYIFDLSSDFDFEISIRDLSFSQVLKHCNLTINCNYRTLVEKVLEYITLVRELVGDKLFILVNIRSFISDQEAQLFINTVTLQDIKVLFIESYDKALLRGENRITIDNDLCEF